MCVHAVGLGRIRACISKDSWPCRVHILLGNPRVVCPCQRTEGAKAQILAVFVSAWYDDSSAHLPCLAAKSRTHECHDLQKVSEVDARAQIAALEVLGLS